MEQDIYDETGKVKRFGQMAPGRDLAPLRAQRRPGRPQENINAAITGGMPVGGTETPFKGAEQTLGKTMPDLTKVGNVLGSAVRSMGTGGREAGGIPQAGIGSAIMGSASQFAGPGSVMDSHKRLNPPQMRGQLLNEQQRQNAMAGITQGLPGQPGQLPEGMFTKPQAPAQATLGEAVSVPDRSGWNTDGFSQPGYTAQNFGNAPAGWDATKWQNGDHQTPKYVAGRIMAEAGDLRNPENRAAVLAKLQQAYPGTTDVNGKDKVNIPGVGVVDIFGNATGGEFRPQWLPESEAGAAPAVAPQLMPPTGMTQQQQLTAALEGNLPQGQDYAAQLRQQILAALGGNAPFMV
jgi:hypothetical protein